MNNPMGNVGETGVSGDLSFTDEEISQLMQLGITEDKLADIQQQYKSAEQRRFQEGPQGRFNGRTYMAANPLEHIGAGIQKYRAGKQMQGLQKTREQELAEQVRLRTMAAQKMQGGQPQAQPPMGGAQPPMGGAPGGANPEELRARMLRGAQGYGAA